MASKTYLSHTLFDIIQIQRTHGKKRFHYSFRPKFSLYVLCHVDEESSSAEGQNLKQLKALCETQGRILEQMSLPGFRFRNREEAEQFHLLATLVIN